MNFSSADQNSHLYHAAFFKGELSFDPLTKSRRPSSEIAKQEQQWRNFIHDFKLPLTLLQGELEAIQDGIRPFTPEKISLLLHEIEQLNELLDSVPTLPRKSIPTSHRLCNASATLLSTLKHHEAELTAKGLILKQEIEPARFIEGTTAALSRIFHNLMSNSLKYTEASGLIQISLTTTADKLLLQWQDSAPAPQQDELIKLTQTGFRARLPMTHAAKGCGLGLASISQLVQQLRGSIDFTHSELGGLKVTMQLPLAHRE
ncbi:hypothetical protein KDN34_02275 [Shewanella yunxiaonensis]|uniref:histidine kinase n=1 Tax=Shewanella yunxiaonensis TaxID=2829809 RepID=A0ABX7YUH5_9GAMM|nr:ATP-binding protein [Shewanella yunxiaonensis]QUN06314.1 hypothetical protein KDN34_02275 [Shewanella yunxiaonensis]